MKYCIYNNNLKRYLCGFNEDETLWGKSTIKMFKDIGTVIHNIHELELKEIDKAHLQVIKVEE